MNERFAIIEESSQRVVNIIVYDPQEKKSPWKPHAGHYIVPSRNARIGDRYDRINNTFIPED